MWWCPQIIGFLGRVVLSHLQMLFSILVCQAPSLCACTLGVFLSLGILTRSSGLDGLSHLLLLCGCVPSLLFFCWTEYVGTAILGGFSGCTVAMWLDIRLWTCILLDLVLYLCTSGMLHDLPSYGCVSGERAYVSSRMTWCFV